MTIYCNFTVAKYC